VEIRETLADLHQAMSRRGRGIHLDLRGFDLSSIRTQCYGRLGSACRRHDRFMEDTTATGLPLPLPRNISLPSTEKESEMGLDSVRPRREPWNKGKLVGQKAPLKIQNTWAIRVRLQMQEEIGLDPAAYGTHSMRRKLIVQWVRHRTDSAMLINYPHRREPPDIALIVLVLSWSTLSVSLPCPAFCCYSRQVICRATPVVSFTNS
jgi:hypothetical protein